MSCSPDKRNFERNDLRIILTDGTWTLLLLLNLQRCVDTTSTGNEDSCGTLTENILQDILIHKNKTYCHRLLAFTGAKTCDKSQRARGSLSRTIFRNSRPCAVHCHISIRIIDR